MQEAQAEELAYVDHSNDEDPSINQYYINAVLEELNKMDISLDQEFRYIRIIRKMFSAL